MTIFVIKWQSYGERTRHINNNTITTNSA